MFWELLVEYKYILDWYNKVSEGLKNRQKFGLLPNPLTPPLPLSRFGQLWKICWCIFSNISHSKPFETDLRKKTLTFISL